MQTDCARWVAFEIDLVAVVVVVVAMLMIADAVDAAEVANSTVAVAVEMKQRAAQPGEREVAC